MRFEEDIHLHAGYYEKNYDLEGIFFKQKDEEIWCLFFQNNFYKLPLKKHFDEYDENFGYLVRKYNIQKDDLTEEIANKLFKEFLLEEKLIK